MQNTKQKKKTFLLNHDFCCLSISDPLTSAEAAHRDNKAPTKRVQSDHNNSKIFYFILCLCRLWIIESNIRAHGESWVEATWTSNNRVSQRNLCVYVVFWRAVSVPRPLKQINPSSSAILIFSVMLCSLRQCTSINLNEWWYMVYAEGRHMWVSFIWKKNNNNKAKCFKLFKSNYDFMLWLYKSTQCVYHAIFYNNVSWFLFACIWRAYMKPNCWVILRYGALLVTSKPCNLFLWT